jgi:hypothetical protein
MMLTTEKEMRGSFLVFWNGKNTKYRIINGSIGVSGRNTANIYGIVTPSGKYRWIGSLQACKKALALTFKKIEAKIAAVENA